MLLKLLEDQNGEVQNLAVKCLGPLVAKVGLCDPCHMHPSGVSYYNNCFVEPWLLLVTSLRPSGICLTSQHSVTGYHHVITLPA